jgi:hypothetical protein
MIIGEVFIVDKLHFRTALFANLTRTPQLMLKLVTIVVTKKLSERASIRSFASCPAHLDTL